jgi:hypothetical protein
MFKSFLDERSRRSRWRRWPTPLASSLRERPHFSTVWRPMDCRLCGRSPVTASWVANGRRSLIVEARSRPVSRDLRWGVFVTFKAPPEYARRCFADCGIKTDPSGWYGATYKPYHFIGLELGVSVASVVLRGEATGAPGDFRADAAAVAKRHLSIGETLDGEKWLCGLRQVDVGAKIPRLGRAPDRPCSQRSFNEVHRGRGDRLSVGKIVLSMLRALESGFGARWKRCSEARSAAVH